ncbi:MAG: tRNA intron endonuclease [Benniella sp.]|nr:MAG: tRNA intron endonuclease [Benniella sp.]
MKFEDLRDECLLYPEHAEQLFQVYLDLREAKDFEEVNVIPAPLLGRCLIHGLHPDTGNRYLVLPSLVTETWTVNKMDALFSALSREQNPQLRAEATFRITLGIIANDSTVTYLNLYRGIPSVRA